MTLPRQKGNGKRKQGEAAKKTYIGGHKLTIDIDPKLALRLRVCAAAKGLKMRELAAIAIASHLATYGTVTV